MESSWEMLETINNGYNFPTGHSIAWCLTDYFPMSNEMKQKQWSELLLQMGTSKTLSLHSANSKLPQHDNNMLMLTTTLKFLTSSI